MPTVTRRQALLLSSLSVTTFLALWEALPALGLVKPLFTSSPSRIAVTFVELAQGRLWHDLWVSGMEFVLGMALAIVVGIPAGVLLGWSSRLNAIFGLYVSALYAVPRVALMPLLILWLGIGIYSKVAVVFLGAVFPILVNTMTGVRMLDATLVRCAHAFGANDRQILTTIALPSSVPFILAGLRLGVGRGLVGVVVGELIAAQAGIGHMMSIAGATFQTDKVFVGVVILAGFGWGVTALLEALEQRFDSWRPRR